MQILSHYNNMMEVGLYLQAGRLSVVLQQAGVAIRQSLGSLQYSWKRDTYAHSRHDRWQWFLCPKWMEMKWSARKPKLQSWTDGQMFVLVCVEKTSVFTQSRIESGPSQLTEGIQNIVSLEGTLWRRKKKKKKPALHKWVKSRVRVLSGVINVLAVHCSWRKKTDSQAFVDIDHYHKYYFY